MNTKQLADKLDVVPNTVRRWCAEYHRYLSSTAHPPRGQTRILTPLDCRVLAYIAATRDVGQPQEMIMARLDALMAADWQDLPELPLGWGQPEPTVSVVRASEKAFDFAQIAVLQKELEYRDQRLAEAHQALESAQGRVIALENEIATLRVSSDATAAEKHQLQLDLLAARGDVAELRARLAAYAITGGERPLPVLLIAGAVALAVLAALVLLLIVVRLVL